MTFRTSLFVLALLGTLLGSMLRPAVAATAPQSDPAPLDFVMTLPSPDDPVARISPDLLNAAAVAQNTTDFLVILSQQVDSAALAAHHQQVYLAGIDNTSADWLAQLEASRLATRTVLYTQLTTTAQTAQEPLRAWLDAQQIPYQAYYLVNMLEITGDLDLMLALAARPDVAQLVPNPLIHAGEALASPELLDETTIAAGEAGMTQADPPQNGVDFARAPQVWDMGYRGQGIIVAGGDTGVQWNHPSLQTKYRGWNATAGTVNHNYSWLDAWQAEDAASNQPTICANATGACDDWGHGTHTMGTMVADSASNDPRRIGMAPDARWIACRNMRANFGTPAKYTACFQFFLAPYPLGGDPFQDGDPSRGADVINNSWGCPGSEGCTADSLREIVDTMRAAGIFVVASAGNSGPSCRSVAVPPGIHAGAFSVGAHNLLGDIASFSSRGPVTVDNSGRLKPNLVAPGVGIFSTYLNNGYTSLAGTSMAAPHVAGTVALLWSAVPALRGNVALSEEILLKSATPVLNNRCDGEQPPLSPNNTYGYGRLDAYRAVLIALSPWNVNIRVRNAQGAPQANVVVELEDERTGLRLQQVTNSEGWARWQNVYPGAYGCRVELAANQLGATGISLAPAATFPDETSDVRGLTVGSCQGQAASAPSGDLYMPAVRRD